MLGDAFRADPWMTRQLRRTSEPAGPVIETVLAPVIGIFLGMRRTQLPSHRTSSGAARYGFP